VSVTLDIMTGYGAVESLNVFSFGALTLLVWQQERHLTCEKLHVVLLVVTI